MTKVIYDALHINCTGNEHDDCRSESYHIARSVIDRDGVQADKYSMFPGSTEVSRLRGRLASAVQEIILSHVLRRIETKFCRLYYAFGGLLISQD